MNRTEKWYIDRYIRAVSRFLPCSCRTKRRILDDLRQQAEAYLAEGGDVTMLDAHFGLPRQVAESYVDSMSTAELLAELHIRRRMVRLAAIGRLNNAERKKSCEEKSLFHCLYVL